jgi:hypothetical protein
MWYYLALASAALLVGVGVVIAGVRIVAATAPAWMLWAVQLLVTVVAVIGGLAVVARVAALLLGNATEQLVRIAARYPEQLAAAAKRRPTIAVVLVLLSEAVVVVSGSMFEGTKTVALAVSFVMLIGYWVSNELMLAEGRSARMLGVVLWFGITAFLPYAIAVSRHWTVADLGRAIASLPFPELVFFGFAGVVIMVLPVIVPQRTAD